MSDVPRLERAYDDACRDLHAAASTFVKHPLSPGAQMRLGAMLAYADEAKENLTAAIQRETTWENTDEG